MLIQSMLKNGVYLHPFHDQSGICLFNDNTTEMVTLFMQAAQIERLLDGSTRSSREERRMLQSLEDKGFIYEHSLSCLTPLN
jgi:hypothetical protein